MSINSVVKGLSGSLQTGQSKRIDCPSCGGKGCMSVSKMGGKVVYYCFRANCGVKGLARGKMSEEELLSIKLSNTVGSPSRDVFVTPDHFTRTLPLEVTDYLCRHNCLSALLDNRIRVMYDTLKNRCVFLLYSEFNMLVGAVGRYMGEGAADDGGKWRRYDKYSSVLFPSMQDEYMGSTCILVEDTLSAIVCGYFMPAIPLLGTSLSTSVLSYVTTMYDRIGIALDPDLCTFTDDPKNLPLDSIEEGLQLWKLIS